MKKIRLNKIKISDLNLNIMDEKSMDEIQGALNCGGHEISPDRTDGCTDGFTSGCTDGCPILGTVYNCTNSYCTDDCPGPGIPKTTTDVVCKTHIGC